METPSRLSAEVTRIEEAVGKAIEKVNVIKTFLSSGLMHLFYPILYLRSPDAPASLKKHCR